MGGGLNSYLVNQPVFATVTSHGQISDTVPVVTLRGGPVLDTGGVPLAMSRAGSKSLTLTGVNLFPPIELELSSDLKEMKLNTSRYDSMVRWLIERGIGSMVMPRPTGCGGLLKCGSSDPVPGDHTAGPTPDWAAVFGNPTQDLHLDLGCGKGHFMMELSRRACAQLAVVLLFS